MTERMTRQAFGAVARLEPHFPVEPDVRLGLSANWRQFTLLVVINAFVGAMVGLERVVLPIVATSEFGIASTTAVLSFIATFGLTKADQPCRWPPADAFGVSAAIGAIGTLTIASGLLVAFRFEETSRIP